MTAAVERFDIYEISDEDYERRIQEEIDDEQSNNVDN